MKFWFLPLLALLLSCSTKPVAPPEPLLPVPSPQQLAWHAMEMNAFVHFSINTFTDKEWGYGDEAPGQFQPTDFDADQWVRTFSETGFGGVILTCKHHDGFCLWPSQFTEHSVKNSSWQNGTGDVVKAVAEACKKYGLRFGIYVSPWDRNHKNYGTPAYLDYYRKQLKELFQNYGPIFEMWFDGANGGDGYYGGSREKRSINGATYYDWPTTLEQVTRLEPSVIFFSDAGPGVRWVGNEQGIAGETNWNLISPDTLYAGKGGIKKLLNTGSENGTHWIPAEVDVSIRPGWFYHSREDSMVKSPEQLFNIYLTSVGRGSTLLLNVPPDLRGLLNEVDVAALRDFHDLVNQRFSNDLARAAVAVSETVRGSSSTYAAANVNDGDSQTYWATDDGQTAGAIELRWQEERDIQYVALQEYIPLGQRVKRFTVEAWMENSWKQVAEGTTIGYKRILSLRDVQTDQIRISILDSRACPLLQTVSVY